MRSWKQLDWNSLSPSSSATIQLDGARKAGQMAEYSSGRVVVSDLPDLTGVALADLPAMSLRNEDMILERVTDHPNNQEQEFMSV